LVISPVYDRPPPLATRDVVVIDACHRRAIPIALTLAGGYARELADVVTIHGTTVAERRRTYG
jgi:hypothetical protein